MLKWMKRSHELAVRFCERCGQVCGSLCRAEAIRERAVQRSFAVNGWRSA